MQNLIPGRYAALALLIGGLACAGNKNTDDTMVASDSTRMRDTSAYQGMNRDTTAMPAMGAKDSTRDLPSAGNPDSTKSTMSDPASPAGPTGSAGVERADTLNGNMPTGPTGSPSAGASDTVSGMTRDSAGKASAQ